MATNRSFPKLSLRLWVALIAVLSMIVAAIILYLTNSVHTVSLQSTMGQFAANFRAQNASGAAELTSSPAQAKPELERLFANMHAQKVDVNPSNIEEFSDGSAVLTLTFVWDFGQGRKWSRTGKAAARKLSYGWRLSWDPSILAPGMTDDTTLRQVRTDATPAPVVLDASHKPLMALTPVNLVYINPATTRNFTVSAQQLAAVLRPVASLVTAKTLITAHQANPHQSILAVTLRNDDFSVVSRSIRAIDGVDVVPKRQLLAVNRQLDTPAFRGITAVWQAGQDKTSGWAVQLVNPHATNGVPSVTQLAGEQGPPGPPIATTINTHIQQNALDAVRQVGQPAAMVVMTTTGAITGIGQNDYAPDDFVIKGQAPSGHAMDQVLQAVTDKAGNDPQQQQRIFETLGLANKLTIPGGSFVGNDNSNKVSPVGMALLAASIAQGKTATPRILAEQPGTITPPPAPIDPAVLQETRSLMLQEATTGDASDIKKPRGFLAAVGTNGPRGPAWMIGIDGGLVFSIYTNGDKSGVAALQVANYFLRKL